MDHIERRMTGDQDMALKWFLREIPGLKHEHPIDVIRRGEVFKVWTVAGRPLYGHKN